MKKVNVIANTPVHGVYITPIIGKIFNKEMSEDQIFRCLVGGAKVFEILLNGEEVQLTFKNYNKNNNKELKFEQPLSFTEQELSSSIQKEVVIKKVEETIEEDSSNDVEEKIEEVIAEEQIVQEDIPDIVEDKSVEVLEEVKTETVINEVIKDEVTISDVKKEAVKPQMNINRRHHKK